MKVLLCGSWREAEAQTWRQALAQALPDIQWLDIEQARANSASVAAAVVANPAAGSLQGLPGLRLIQSLWAGVDRLLEDPTLPADVPLARMVDPAMTAAMTETALWAVLALHRGFFAYARRQAAAQWQVHAQRRAQELHVLVLGQGVMGSAVALALHRQGYRVSSWRRAARAQENSGPPPVLLRPRGGPGRATPGPWGCSQENAGPPQVFLRPRGGPGRATPGPWGCSKDSTPHPEILEVKELAQTLPQAQIVINLLPLTPQTRGLIDARFLAALSPDASLVNLARGAHVVEADLLAALEGGRLRHAVLDVFQTEPLPADHPFWRHPRVTVLPHAAALTDVPTAAGVVAENLRRLGEGTGLLHLVQRQRGY